MSPFISGVFYKLYFSFKCSCGTMCNIKNTLQIIKKKYIYINLPHSICFNEPSYSGEIKIVSSWWHINTRRKSIADIDCESYCMLFEFNAPLCNWKNIWFFFSKKVSFLFMSVTKNLELFQRFNKKTFKCWTNMQFNWEFAIKINKKIL